MENDANSEINKSVNARLLPPEELSKRESYFRNELGFSQQHLDNLKQFRPSLYSIDTIQKHVSGLQERGFDKPQKMIESSPAILGYGFENIDSKISGLLERGFGNPNKMIESSPAILDLGFENIDSKISGLQTRGFSNPHKMIESVPQILGYGFENIDSKISGLLERGFPNPHKMIESSPAILGLGFENIDSKLRLLDLLNKTYDLRLNPTETIENSPAILGVKFDKLIVIARVLREYNPSIEDVQRKLKTLYTPNLESLLVSYSLKKPNDTIDDLTRNAGSIQKEKMSKEYKRDLIKNFFSQNPEADKIYRDYLKGYPEKSKNFSPVE